LGIDFLDVIRPLLLLLFGVLAGWPTWAQVPLYRHIGLGEGLLSQLVYATFQDRDGYIWFATDEGACRTDGKNFEYFTTDQGLCDNEVLNIDQDSKGRIWFLTLSGCLSYYHQGKVFNATNEPGLAHDVRTIGFAGINEDKQGNVYIFGLANDLLKYDGVSVTSQKFFQDDMLLPTITFGYRDAQNEPCFLNRHEQFRIIDGQLKNVTTKPIDYLRINCFTQANIGFVILSANAVSLVSDTGLVELGDKKCFPNWSRYMSINYLNDFYWFSLYDGGVEEWQFVDGKWQFVQMYLSSAIVNSVMADTQENLWFSTRDQGVFFLPKHAKEQKVYLNNSNYQVMSMVKLPDDQGLLFGTDHGDIMKISEVDNNSVEPYYQSQSRAAVNELALTIDGRVVCINQKGLFWVEEGRLKPINNELNQEIPKCFALDQNGGIYVFGMIRCVHIPNLDRPDEIEIVGNIANERVYHMVVDQEGVLWYEQHDNLYRYKNGVSIPHEAFNELSTGRVSDIELSKDGRVIVATYGSGVFVLRDDRIDMQFNINNGLNSNECRYILCTEHALYLHTSAGLWQVEYSPTSDFKPRLITSLDHLANKKINAIVLGDERFFIGTHTGLYSAPFAAESTPIPVLAVIIESINQQTLVNVNSQTYQIDYGHSIHLKYTAIGYGWVENLEFEYRLRNQDTTWIRTTARGVDFSNMPWGANIFEIRARHPYGEWSPVRTMNVLVRAPFYASWWFRSLIFVIFLTVIYCGVEYYLKRRYAERMAVIEQDRLLLAERNRISTDLHDEIGAEVSNIVILSRIAQAKLRNNDSPETSIAKIDRAANDMINKMNGIIWSLNPGNDDLMSLVEYLKRYCNDYFELHEYSGGVEIEGKVRQMEVKGIIRRNLFLILKECLHNVYKHSRADFVRVIIKIDGHKMVIEIHDNGVGFDQGEIKRGRLGLQSMRRRVQDIGGQIEVSSKLGIGTTIVGTFVI
jgi:signal transduction histidine kinase